MTDTREVFKESMTKLFGNNKSPLGQAIAYQIWQACEAHYKERIAELEKDAERLDYLLHRLTISELNDIRVHVHYEDNKQEIKEAIDQAIAESK